MMLQSLRQPTDFVSTRFSIAAILVASCVLTTEASDKDKVQSKFAKIIERKVTLENGPFLATTLACNVDIGDVPANSLVLLQLSLENPFDRSLTIKSIGSSCRCLDSAIRGEIPANSVTPIEVTLKTQSHSSTVDQLQHLRFLEDSEDIGGFLLSVSYRLEGLLTFTKDLHYERIPESKSRNGSTFRVPFLVSRPVVLWEVKVSLTNELQNAKARVIEEKGLNFVEIEFRSDLTSEALPGEIKLQERHARSDAKIPVFVQLEKDINIAPQIPKFIWSEVKRAYVATAMVRVTEAQSEIESSMKIRSWLPDAGNAKLSTNVQKLNARIARVEHVLEFDGGRFVQDTEANFKNRLALEVTGIGKKIIEDQVFEIFP